MSAGLVLFIGALILFVGGGARFAIGLTLKPIELEFAAGRGLIGLAVAIFQLISAIAMFWAGRLADRVNLALVLSGGIAVAAVGLGALAWTSASWQILLFYGVVFAIGNGVASVIPVGVMVTRKFPERPGLANAAALTGLGLGQLAMMAALGSVLGDIGWRNVFFWLGMAHLAILPLVVVVVSRVTSRAAPVAVRHAGLPAIHGLSIAEAAKTRRFWLLLAVYGLCGFEDFFVSTHIVAFAQDRGADVVLAGNLLAVMGLMALIGVLLAGVLSDRVGPVAATLTSFALRLLIFAMVLIDQQVSTVAIFGLMFGLTFLMTAPLTVSFVREAFGDRHLGALTGLVTMVHHICGGLGALIGATLYDAQGSYDAVLWMMLGSSVFGAILTLGLSRRWQSVERKQ